MKTLKVFLSLLITSLLLNSCVEKIDLKLDQADYTLLIVEGTITDIDSIQTIYLKLTAPYDSDKPCPPATGAQISVNDGDNTYYFSETSPGVYQNASLQGVVNNTYKLRVDYEGTVYTATSKMHPTFAIDSLRFIDYPFGLPADKPHFEILVYGQECPQPNQYYFFQHAVNGVWRDTLLSWTPFSDFVGNGQYVKGNGIGIFETDEDSVKIKVRALSCDETLFWFFDRLMFNIMPNMFFSPPPANVQGNISNGALGFFWATSIFETKEYVVYTE